MGRFGLTVLPNYRIESLMFFLMVPLLMDYLFYIAVTMSNVLIRSIYSLELRPTTCEMELQKEEFYTQNVAYQKGVMRENG